MPHPRRRITEAAARRMKYWGQVADLIAKYKVDKKALYLLYHGRCCNILSYAHQMDRNICMNVQLWNVEVISAGWVHYTRGVL